MNVKNKYVNNTEIVYIFKYASCNIYPMSNLSFIE